MQKSKSYHIYIYKAYIYLDNIEQAWRSDQVLDTSMCTYDACIYINIQMQP